jgi:hypothetical protein
MTPLIFRGAGEKVVGRYFCVVTAMLKANKITFLDTQKDAMKLGPANDMWKNRG